ncbi:MAG: O-antigen ligase family protein [Bacteroidia bacterium]|nr:O-antigen ligase family protein [Bacteroidia bacterium]
MKSYLTPRTLAFLASVVLVIGLSTGKALLSISTVALAFAAAWNCVLNGFPRLRTKETKTVIWLIGILLVALLSGIWTENSALWAKDVYGKIPFLLIPLAIYLLPKFAQVEWRWLKLLFLATQSFVAIVTLVKFIFTYKEQMTRVAENSYIDVVGSISHIYFGLLLGWSVLIGLSLWEKSVGKWSLVLRWIILAMVIVNAIAIHILVSRTGLLSFYAGIASYGFVWLWQRGHRWVLIGLSALLMLGPVMAFYTVPSFRLRMEVTLWDWQQYQQSEADLTDNSLSLRLLAWKSSWGIVKEHPLLGVGIEDVGDEMLQQYEAQGLDSRAEGLLTNPHNQYLKQWAGAGLAGLLVLLLAIGQPIWETRKKVPPLVLAFAMTMLVAMCFESMLERQIGMTFFAAFTMWLLREEEL